MMTSRPDPAAELVVEDEYGTDPAGEELYGGAVWQDTNSNSATQETYGAMDGEDLYGEMNNEPLSANAMLGTGAMGGNTHTGQAEPHLSPRQYGEVDERF